jgi:hypothetical protein
MNDHSHEPRRATPYWRRAHQDWRFVTVVMLMVVAIALYLMSDDLRLQPKPLSQLPFSGTSVK